MMSDEIYTEIKRYLKGVSEVNVLEEFLDYDGLKFLSEMIYHDIANEVAHDIIESVEKIYQEENIGLRLTLEQLKFKYYSIEIE